MSKKPKQALARAEVEVIKPIRVPHSPEEMAQLLNELVRKQVAETLANRDAWLLEPYFRTRQVALEIKRLQTVPEQRKWAVYFERFGCTGCKTQSGVHYGHGMCQRCVILIHHRLAVIVAELSKQHGENNRDAERLLLGVRQLSDGEE